MTATCAESSESSQHQLAAAPGSHPPATHNSAAPSSRKTENLTPGLLSDSIPNIREIPNSMVRVTNRASR